MNSLAQVRRQAQEISESATYCTIVKDGVEKLAKEIDEMKPIIWDNEGAHFFNPENAEISAKYILVLSAMNFCFWPKVTRDGVKEEFEYHNLAGGLRNIAKESPNEFESDSLKNMDAERLKKWFGGLVLPQHEERVRLLREIGTNLKTSMKEFVSSANKVCGG